MENFVRMSGLLLLGWLTQACSVSPPPDTVAPGQATRQIVAERVSAVVVTDRNSLDKWVNRNFESSHAPGDADGGSAAPISPDGYFLTADHVLSRIAGRNVFLIYGQGGRLVPTKARVVWRSEGGDLALLHIPVKTPYYYQWTPPERWLPAGNVVIHGGISTGFKSADGKLGTALAPESAFTRTRSFKIDIPLQPGDSGGPVVDAYGRLVGINSAVEFLVPMETAFFIDSEGNRPNTRHIDAMIQNDRARNSGRIPAAN
ncbi:MAG: serine protease [Verrucomicrobiota bacterium]